MGILFILFCIQAFDAERTLIAVGIPFLFNLILVIVQLVSVGVYFLLRKKKYASLVDTVIGLGDIAFMVICTIAFSTANFLVFYVASLLIALVGTGLLRILKNDRTDIPLVGYMAFMLVVCIILKLSTTSFDFYNDAFLLNIINN